ncbi:hypothetical protein BD769DRAFT_818749 [Suillus cothurnatus]|nr:hypothetical protein BD769DRAFT_818749 [Suillus cothurnatus]
MNVRHGDMLRPQSMAQLNPSPHFQQQPPQQQQQPPSNHVSLMQTNSMNLLAAGPQSQNMQPHAQFDLRRRQQQQLHQMHQHQQQQQQQHQQQQQQAQNVQMNTAAVASQANSHMNSIPQHPLQPIAFSGNMTGNNLGQVRRVSSHPQALNQVNHVQAIHPGQPNMPGIPPMNQQNNIPSHLRQSSAQPMLSRMPGSIPGSMSPDLLNRSQGQNPMRTQSSQPQLMNSLPQPTLPQAGTPTTMPPNGFPSHSHHPITSSSPRPSGPPQGHTNNMIMGTPGPSQPPGARPMNPGDGVFIGIQNPQFNPGFTPGGNRISSANSSFTTFVPSSIQGDIEMQQNMTDVMSNSSTRAGFPTPAQQFEMHHTDNGFGGANFSMPNQVNAPPRPPSHPTSGAHPSIPPRQPPPPHQHSPHQPDPMASQVQPPPRPQSQPQGPSVRPPSQAGPSQTPRASHTQLPPSSSTGLLPPTRIPPITQAQTSPHQQRQATPGQQPIAPRPPQSSTSVAAAPPVTTAPSSESTVPPPIRASPV